MAFSWTLYLTVTVDAGLRAIERAEEELEAMLGPARLQVLSDPGRHAEVAHLGSWPELAATGGWIPTPVEERACLDEPKQDVRYEEAALERLGHCRARIEIFRPRGFDDDPMLVTTVRSLLASVGPAVFCEQRGFDLVTSETLSARLARHRDLAAALKEDDEADAPASAEAVATADAETAEELRRMLGFIAEDRRARRRAGELIEAAPAIVGRLAASLGRDGAGPDEAIARRLSAAVAEIVLARRALARIVERVGR